MSSLPSSHRHGMTLLEVLVSIGILVAGLASIAALMPAAGARLADATAIDRAGTLAANAHADLRNRGILTSSACFPGNTEITAISGRICVFGTAFPAGSGQIASGSYSITSGTLTTGTFCSRTTSDLTMSLQDDIQLSATNTLVTNSNSLSYSVTVVPTSTGTVSTGTPALVGVVVFKRPDVTWMQIPLIKIGAGVFEIQTLPTPLQNESTRKQFLPACSWVFAARGGVPAESRWLQIASSWTTQSLDAQGRLVPDRSFVSFSDATSAIVDSVAVSGTLNVQAFTNVLSVDQRPATLK
jgi:type II secretory pathway pseudopilin PulG